MLKILIIILLLFSCKTPEKYNVTGVIKDIKQEENRLLIDHDEIPGFMVKMVMYFNLDSSVDINEFSINDSVNFDLIVTKNTSYTLNYLNLGKSSIIEDDFWDEDKDKYKKLTIGETIDDATFLTIDNKSLSLSDIESEFILMSFIFSKCPMPNMCPASIVKNQFLANNFINEDITFLIISFDYIYDTPTVLKNIYGNLNKDNLIFLSSYNRINDIFKLTQQVGVAFWGVEENNIGHNMKSVLIDKNLKLMNSFDGTDWKPGDVKKDIENILKVYK